MVSLDLRFIVQHIQGCKNVLADALSRPDKVVFIEWKLHPNLFTMIDSPNIDLLATSQNCQLKNYISWFLDPLAVAVDALSVLLHRILQKIHTTWNLILILVIRKDPLELPVTTPESCQFFSAHLIHLQKALGAKGYSSSTQGYCFSPSSIYMWTLCSFQAFGSERNQYPMIASAQLLAEFLLFLCCKCP